MSPTDSRQRTVNGTPRKNTNRFLDASIFGRNFYQFRNRYAIMGGFNRKQIVGYKDLDGLIRKEHSIAFRITKEEAIDLPEQTFIKRKVQLGKKEKDLYNQIKRSSYAELSNGDKITATTVLTRLLRLQQLAGGFLVTDDSDKPELVNTAKLDALQDIIEDYVLGAGKKLVIFARFIPEVTAIMKMIDKTFQKTGKKQVAIYGAIKKEDRGPIIKQFQEDPDTVIIVGQIDTLGVGVTLTAADTCVYYSKNFNYATYEQSLSRIHRIGQRNTCTYIDLETEGTVDEMIGKALARKEDMAKTVVDDWRAYFEYSDDVKKVQEMLIESFDTQNPQPYSVPVDSQEDIRKVKAYVCSKYRAKNEVEMQQHIMDAMEACRAVHERGDIPVAPHLYWPRFLDEGNPEDRDYGLQAGMEALKRCDQMVVIIRQEGPEDEWISQGMQAEITAAAKMGIEPQFIYIGKEKR